MGPEVGLEMGPGQGPRHVPNDSKTQGGWVGPRKKQSTGLSELRSCFFRRYELFSESVLEFSQKLFLFTSSKRTIHSTEWKNS